VGPLRISWDAKIDGFAVSQSLTVVVPSKASIYMAKLGIFHQDMAYFDGIFSMKWHITRHILTSEIWQDSEFGIKIRKYATIKSPANNIYCRELFANV
jgi:hypothetical protein